MSEAALTLEIKNTRPIEVVDFSQSLLCLADEFNRHLHAFDQDVFASDVNLYIKEVRTGSIIADIVAAAPQSLQLISYVSSVYNFAHYLSKAYRFLSGESDEKPELNRSNYENLSAIVEPIAKDRGSQINIATLTVQGDLILNINSQEANAIQNAARRELNVLKEPITGLHEKVLLYWYQARGDAKSRTGDRAVIESISPSSVKTVCANDVIKAQMILSAPNPFKNAFVVDVIVETINGKPALYKILELHDTIIDESDSDE